MSQRLLGNWPGGMLRGFLIFSEQRRRRGPMLGTPMGGVVPTAVMFVLDKSVEDGVKLIVSGGIDCSKDLAANICPGHGRTRESMRAAAH